LETNTFFGQHYRQIAYCRGARKANVAIVWQLLSDPDARYIDPHYR
jgi:hypothetical protein